MKNQVDYVIVIRKDVIVIGEDKVIMASQWVLAKL